MDSSEITQLGASLREIDRALLTNESKRGDVRLWYQGGEPYFDLFVELEEEEVIWFQLTLRGRVLSWKKSAFRDLKSPFSGWHTGRTNELQTDDVAFYSASKTIEHDRQLDRDFAQLVRAIMETRAGDPIFDRILSLFGKI
ncbi:MAG: hypothetical protein SW833_22635 [Cyanobacteriota bacterium]|nr:hypothetical protein [Cyanobacteriota bacterium]